MVVRPRSGLSRRTVLAAALCSALVPALIPARRLRAQSLAGRTAMITGSTDGLGREVARRIGAMGATVIVHGRNSERGAEVVDEINSAGPGQAVFYRADLASLGEVRDLSARVLAAHARLDLLINNAGLGGSAAPERRLSTDGHELVFAVNYLSHFLLTHELLPLIRRSAPARIVNVASIGQAPLDFEDLMLEQDYSPRRAYSQSKLAQIMFTIDLAERLAETGVTVTSLHPATFMDTTMVRSGGGTPLSTVEEGADAVMQLAVSPELEGRTGLYFNGLEEARANDQAYDGDARAELWSASMDLAGLGGA
jgi:NAD(P)-dependent dehydrogenase (short-subunit alcohol dehydrogenase family)